MNHYDVVIIGAGQAALPLARKLEDKGRSVAIVERKHLCGSCVNFSCTHTKALVASARVAHLARRAGEFGISVPADSGADLPRIRDGIDIHPTLSEAVQSAVVALNLWTA